MAQLRFFAALKVFHRNPLFNTCAFYIQLLFIVLNDIDLYDHFLHLSASATLLRYTRHCSLNSELSNYATDLYL